ncbi:hypothetical protein OROMI_008193 [Orobanche minor]
MVVDPSFDALRTLASSSKVFHLLLLTFGYPVGVQAQCIKSCIQLGCLFDQLDRTI